MYINNLGHMTKMAAMPIYGKNPSKIIFSETNRLISRKLGVRHRWLKYSNVYINHDPVMTLTKFMARSTWVACASELGKLLKCHLKEKANRKLANGQNIEDSEKRKWPKGLSAPALELNTIIFKHVYWYMQLISGERLQDHWSSGYKLFASSRQYEPRREKTGLRPGLTQTGLYNHRSRLEAWNFGFRKEWNGTIHEGKTKGIDQLCITVQLICHFVFA